MIALSRRPFRPSARLLLLAFLAVAVGSACGQEQKAEHDAIKPAPRDNEGWKRRHQSFVERAKEGKVEVLFLGDSITEAWSGPGKEAWKKAFEPLRPANFGIGGDRTQHVLWRITEGKELEGIQPKAVVLMIGTNNTRDNSAEQIADGVTAIVKELRHQRPHARVLLLGIFPRAEKPDNSARAKIKDTNQRIAKLDDGKHVKYLDIGDKFLETDGTISKEIMPDFLHLTPKGYQIWADAIKGLLEGLLRE